MESREEVASSSNRMGACLRKALAMAIRCFWPPDNLMPRSPTRDWYCSGSSEMNSWQRASLVGFDYFCITGFYSGEADIFHDGAVEQVRFLRMVPTCFLRVLFLTCLISWPSIEMLPDCTSINRKMSLIKVDLPPPE